ncbi:MAG: hypothetical protein B7Y43_01070 [Sphingomonas sp. 28-62-20]|uniref:outer membrane protein n=1 Tax=Sphingomonas sp. 28-62-20 TaxID=1970433 RepID=UPI000BCD2ACF|nr:MAG: hypothetical protein B7Y43_01070 [Sphingomonas sp. 28-62-20]
MRTLFSALSLSALAAATLATPALAQDTGRAPFTGPRVGAILGYDGTRPGSSTDSDIAGDDQTADGLLYGGDVGYDVAAGRFVFGAEAELTAGDGTTETGRHFNLDGYRVGAGVERALSPSTYAKIEYRYSNYANARLEFPNGTNTNNFSVDTDRHGLAVGLGFRL